MKHSRMEIFAFLVVLGLAGVSPFVQTATAEHPMIEMKDGHTSPLEARITFPDGTKRVVMLIGVGGGLKYGGPVLAERFILMGADPQGAKTVIWLDTIQRIEDTTAETALVITKDQIQHPLKLDGLSTDIHIATPQGGTQILELSRIKSLEFTKPSRKDSNGNAIFNQWKYSPYTGEMLPTE